MRGLLHILMLTVFTAVCLVTIAPQLAVAQERVERRTLFDMIFGRPRREVREWRELPPFEEEVRPPVTRRPKVERAKKPTPKKQPETAPVVVQKLENAKKILVIGDFMAGGLGEGLQAAFSSAPGVAVETRSNGSSGLVRDDYYDWPATLPTLIDDIKPAMLIVMIGANDRQQVSIDGQKEKFRTERWFGEYQKRVQELATIARERQIPFLWVGMPAFQSSAMTADMVTLNGYFRTEAERTGGEFIDVWDGFVDEEGKFVLTGSDINGQQVRLRGADGISLTTAGKRKMAFYAEKDVRRLLGEPAVSDGAIPGTEGLSDLIVTAPALQEDIIRTQPISLADPALDGGSALLGTAPAATPDSDKSPRDLLVKKGQPGDAPPGRVDDFRLVKTAPVEAGKSTQ